MASAAVQICDVQCACVSRPESCLDWHAVRIALCVSILQVGSDTDRLYSHYLQTTVSDRRQWDTKDNDLLRAVSARLGTSDRTEIRAGPQKERPHF